VRGRTAPVAEFYALVRSLWLLWLVLLFVAIVAYVYWPSRRKRLESYGSIPLQDDTPDRRER
jgi:cytochrome c oxidase cbb3-type subunit IV